MSLSTRLGSGLGSGSSSRGFGLAIVCCLILGSGSGCAGEDRLHFDRSELERDDAGLVLGEFGLLPKAIVDGDTVKVDGLDASLRLLGIDTEETFKSDKSWREFEVGWDAYLSSKESESSRPIKIPTPLGMDAKHWAEDFFDGVTSVRLERDDPREIRGRYNRFLAYIFVEIDGRWVNYNVEAVRAGMSPYFMKYGYSRRFHDDFVEAEAEAKAAGVGIWSEGAQCYQDYDLRAQWWTGRAEFAAQFEADAETDPSLIALTNWDAMDRIEAAIGEEVELLATVGDIRQGERGPRRVLLSRRMFLDFPLIFWEDEVFEDSKIERYRGEYVRVRGVVTTYTDRRSGRRQLQIEVRDPIQVRTPDYVPPGRPGEVDEDPEFERPDYGADADGDGKGDNENDEREVAVERPADLAPAPQPAPAPAPAPAPGPADLRDDAGTTSTVEPADGSEPEGGASASPTGADPSETAAADPTPRHD